MVLVGSCQDMERADVNSMVCNASEISRAFMSRFCLNLTEWSWEHGYSRAYGQQLSKDTTVRYFRSWLWTRRCCFLLRLDHVRWVWQEPATGDAQPAPGAARPAVAQRFVERPAPPREHPWTLRSPRPSERL